MNTGKKIVAF